MSAAAGGAAAAAAAREMQRRREEEEERVSVMTTEPSGDFEYKIIRSATAMFRKPAKFREVLDEEARAGWELVEKFDDTRIRLRRSIEWREKDDDLAQDPYRIQVGLTEGSLALYVVIGIFGTMAMIIGLIAAFAQK